MANLKKYVAGNTPPVWHKDPTIKKCKTKASEKEYKLINYGYGFFKEEPLQNLKNVKQLCRVFDFFDYVIKEDRIDIYKKRHID
jgi:hypothetical protein